MIELKPFSEQDQIPLRLFWHGGFRNLEFVSSFTLYGESSPDLQQVDLNSLAQDGAFFQADGLWQHTCWEVFFKLTESDRYLETNLSTRGSWQCYQFKKYREREIVSAPVFTLNNLQVESGENKLQIFSRWSMASAGPSVANLQPYPRAVIKYKEGLTYWSARHAQLTPPRPDFHLFT
jgi:hypothetical protein